VKTYVSLNPIMVDGTGMCGSCRVTVGKETKFACVDGPEFDAHQVDFNELMQRQRIYMGQEKVSLERFAEHRCRCGEGGGHHE
jgi:ferredoxin--NADP+ reductase